MEVIEIKDVHTLTDNDVKKMETANQWVSCCSSRKTDSRLLQFITVYIIISSIVAFCLYELSLSNTCSHTQTYMSILTLILGVILPSPKR